jgi:DNA-binding transcriptional regulator LsrR (DeoR family)
MIERKEIKLSELRKLVFEQYLNREELGEQLHLTQTEVNDLLQEANIKLPRKKKTYVLVDDEIKSCQKSFPNQLKMDFGPQDLKSIDNNINNFSNE